jgi:TPP-dependent pyruvate/acetoin dehydrogenase alpha subunit
MKNTGDKLAELPKAKLADIYQKMVTIRKWETKMKDLFVGGKDGLYGSFHVYVGEEAIATGVCAALEQQDYIASTHRGHGHVISKGADINKMSAEIFMRETGTCKGFGGSMHIAEVDKGILGANGIVGAGWYVGAGGAYAAKVKGNNAVSVAFAGEGAAASPYYFSALRSAKNYNLPFIAVIENNGQAITIPSITSHPTNPSSYALGAGIPVTVVDGNDVSEVYAAAKTAVERARSGGGPSVIEAKTYRWYDHSGFAGAKEGVDGAWGLPYRSDSEVQSWIDRCPIKRYKAFLLEKKLLTEEELAKIVSDVDAAVEASVEFARNSPKCTPEHGVRNVFEGIEVPAAQFLML